MRILIVVASIVSLALGGAVSARAEEGAASPGRPGLYAGIGLVYGPSAFDIDGVDASNQFGLDARLGYRIARHVAVEGQYQYVPGYDLDTSLFGTIATLDTNTFTVNGKVFALPDTTFQPYGIGGIGFLHVNGDTDIPGASVDSQTAFAGRVGVGADYYLRPKVVLNLEFSAVLPAGDLSDLRLLPLVFGVQARF